MKSLIKWTIWQRKVSAIWWMIGLGSFNFINLIFYPAFRDQSEELNKSLDQLPEAAKQLFAGSGDFVSPVGYLNAQIFYFLMPLLLSVLAITLGSSLIAKEERDGTIELILARPVSRAKLLLGKAISGILILGAVTLVGLVVIIVTAKFVDLAVPISSMALATLAAFIIALSTGAVAFTLTMIGRSGKSLSIGVATGIALGGYVISSLASTATWLKAPSKLFPFHYYRSEEILRGTLNAKYLLYPLAIIVICAILSWVSFWRRDLSA